MVLTLAPKTSGSSTRNYRKWHGKQRWPITQVALPARITRSTRYLPASRNIPPPHHRLPRSRDQRDNALRTVGTSVGAEQELIGIEPIAVLPLRGTFERTQGDSQRVSATQPVWATDRDHLGLYGTNGNVSEWHDDPIGPDAHGIPLAKWYGRSWQHDASRPTEGETAIGSHDASRGIRLVITTTDNVEHFIRQDAENSTLSGVNIRLFMSSHIVRTRHQRGSPCNRSCKRLRRYRQLPSSFAFAEPGRRVDRRPARDLRSGCRGKR